jgi:hypothetical protein
MGYMKDVDWEKIKIKLLSTEIQIPFRVVNVDELASKQFNVPISEVTKKMREKVKFDTFSDRYGKVSCPLCELGFPQRRNYGIEAHKK